MPNENISIYHRYSKTMMPEMVMAGRWIRLMYSTKLGRLLEFFLSITSIPSKLVGKFYNSKMSCKKIAPFIKKYNINEQEFRLGSIRGKIFSESFSSFNEFFTREFQSDRRPFIQDTKYLSAPAEGRYFATESIHDILQFPVKGEFLRIHDLLPIPEAEMFIQGPLVIARLCPVDYHRYHYPDDGNTLKSYQRIGRYHSVNPMALKAKPNIFIKNERRISILETKHFGHIAFIEVGALFVGTIEQKHDERNSFMRGDLKGQFLFGGSTVILVGEKDRWIPSEDILEKSYNGIETFIKLGDAIATR